MEIKKDIKDYSYFTFEDFLQDDFFVASILNPTEESELFWEDYQNNNRERITDFNKAVRCIKELNKDLLNDFDVTKIWNDIQRSNKNRLVKSKFVYIAGWVAAACIALFFFFRFQSFSPDKIINDSEIKAFADAHSANTEAIETQLILSDHKVLSLSDQESVISYDSISIKVTSQKVVRNEIPKDQSAAFNQLIIPKGKRSFLTLSDGSKIWCNSGTRLVFPKEFNANKREIFVDGEIYLDVQPNKNWPFVVQTSDINIQVLGTEFNIQAYSSDIQKRIVLKSGAVKISSGTSNQQDVLLQPSEMYELNSDKGTVTHVDVDSYTSWINGIYICEKERLDVILIRLSRYYGKEITVDKDAAGLRCNGKLDLKEKLDDVMNIISYIAPISYAYENNKYIVTYKP